MLSQLYVEGICWLLCPLECSTLPITVSMSNCVHVEIQANDQTVKKLAKEMKVRVKTARGERSQQQRYSDDY